MEDFPTRTDVSDIAGKAKYMVLSTASLNIKNVIVETIPHVSPVFFAEGRQLTYYWLPTLDAQHSKNILQNGKVSGVIFDPAAPQGTGIGFYFNGKASVVPDSDEAFPRGNEREVGINLLCEKGETLKAEDLMKPDCPRKLFKMVLTDAWYNGGVFDDAANVWVDKTIRWNPESNYGRRYLPMEHHA